MNPLVSVCIPTYNGEKFLAEAIESALHQTYTNIEIIVSDDTSVDNTLNIVASYMNSTKVPVFVYPHSSRGIGANWNNCIKYANGKYIKFLFQDDVLMPNCVEEMVCVLENNKSIGLVASKREFIVEDTYLNKKTIKWIKDFGDLQRDLNIPLKGGLQILDKKFFKLDIFLESPLNKVGEPSVTLFRKNILKEIGFFSEDLVQKLDYEFYYRILKKYKIAVLDEKLAKFRLHSEQATIINDKNKSSDHALYDKLIYDEYFWYLNLKKQIFYFKKYNLFVKKYMSFAKLFFKIKMKLRL